MSAPIYPKASRRESFAGRDFLDAARHNDPTPNRPASPAPASPAPDSPAGRAVVTIFDAVQQTARQKGWWAVSAVIGRALREDRKLHSRERRYVGDTVHSLLRQLRRLRAIIGGKNPSSAALFATFLIDEWARSPGGDSVAGQREVLTRFAGSCGLTFAEVLARRDAIEQRLATAGAQTREEQVQSLGEALSYPDWLTEAVLAELGLAQAVTVLLAQNSRARLTLRTNLIKLSRDELLARLHTLGLVAEKTPLGPWGVVLDTHLNVYSLPPYEEGLCEVQDESSQLVAELCAPPPGSLLVDACAGAGGKTLALAAMMQNRGRILAFDVDEHKLRELKLRARRAGLSNIETRCLTDEGLQHLVAERVVGRGAERVLVDAPCSGLGVLRRNPEARWRLAPGDLAELVSKQRRLLFASARLCAPHGRLIYATCTILRRENDDIVDEFLHSHPEFVQVPVKEILSSARASQLGDGERLRIYPTENGPDGFFAAVLRRKSD
jgi:16S rRNA (cytosine967-C5)-methyltransferase